MRLTPCRIALTASGLLAAGVGQALAARPPSARPAPAPALSFEQDIRPIFKAYCFDCHGGGEKLEGNLDLRLKRFLEKGGDSGHAMQSRNPGKSLVVNRMKSGEMPPAGKKVPPEKIAIIEQWIAAGAPTLRPEPAQLPAGFDITPEERAYWFFQPVRKLEPPRFKPEDRVRTPIDAFVLKQLRAKGLSFAADADPATLIRRASLDLTGIPPTAAEVEAFVRECQEEASGRSGVKALGKEAGAAAPSAYERLIDRLLASPQYGERWGRHWLDVAGYADSDGNGSDDNPRPFAYKYRDYVIRSLNADKPFNQFLTEQLAGDELVPRPWNNLTPDQIEKLTATGFLRTAVDTSGNGSDPAASNQVVGDTVKIVSSSLLGLSVGCAQCHDHRYDPIPQSDYYRLRAIFEPALDPAHWRSAGQRLLSLYTDEQRKQAAAVEQEAQKLQAAFNEKQAKYVETALEVELQKFPADQREKLRAALKTPDANRTPEQKLLVANNPKLLISPGVLYQYNQKAADELTQEQAVINKKRAERPAEDFLSILTEEPGNVPATRVFYRGDHRDPRAAVMPGDLTIAAPDGKRFEIPAKDPALPTTGRRLAWARYITNGQHPLLGRVLVNRIWLNHFGRGLVDTPGEFGKLGVKPTHPELLDWLAATFVDGKSSLNAQPSTLNAQPWSLKSLHRLIMLSTVYRQASAADGKKRQVDSDGSLYSRFPVRRLDAETLRDRILAAAGRLDTTQFGPPVPLTEDAVGQVTAANDSPRRSVYLQVRRSKPISFLVSFDAPVMTVNCDRRMTSNSAPQALMLMNSDFVLAQAGHFAQRLRKEAPGALDKQVALAWQIAYCRTISAEESDLALRFLEKQKGQQSAMDADKAELAALTNLCQQLLSSNEFLYVD